MPTSGTTGLAFNRFPAGCFWQGLRVWSLTVSLALGILLGSCTGSTGLTQDVLSSRGNPVLPTTQVTLPNGTRIEAEMAITDEQHANGLMFRSELAPDKGMLFVSQRAAQRSFWMYQCLISLDMIWMDGNHRIVEIESDVPPCRDTDQRNCPSYGGKVNSVYVLEMAAGQAAAQKLKPGERLEF